MLKTMRAAVAVLALLACATPLVAADAEQELLAVNRRYDEALLRGDASALDALYAEEFIYTTPDGEVRDKQKQLAFTRKGELRLASARSEDVRIRVYGDFAVMTGRFLGEGTFAGKPLSIRERYTAVWARRNGQWLLIAEQGSFEK